MSHNRQKEFNKAERRIEKKKTVYKVELKNIGSKTICLASYFGILREKTKYLGSAK